MSRKVKLPSLGESVDSGKVLSVLVEKGDRVEEQDPIVELETDKATLEVPSPEAGIVKEILVSEGDEVKTDEDLLVLEDADEVDEDEDTEKQKEGEEEEQAEERDEGEEDEEEDEGEEESEESGDEDAGESRKDRQRRKDKKRKKEKKPRQRKGKKRKDEEQRTKSEDDSGRSHAPSTDTGAGSATAAPGRASAAPHVRRLARELGVDLDRVARAQADRVTEEDVKSHVRNVVARAGEPKGETPELPDFSEWGEVEREPLDTVRRATAETVIDSWKSVPQVTHFERAQVSGMEAFRERYSDRVESERMSLTGVLVKVLGEAVGKFPRFNSSLDLTRGELILKHYVHVGVAVDTPRGLLVPVVRNVQDKGLVEIAEELPELLSAAREGDLGPDDLAGATISLSNVGTIGGSHFTPLVVWPQVAILGVGAMETVLVEKDGEATPTRTLPLSLSYDHRVIDGADAARFARWLAEALENPLSMFLESQP